MWYQIDQGSSPGAEGKLCIDNHDEGNGKPPRFIPPRRDTDCAIVSKDNSVNEAVSQWMVESRSAEKGVINIFYRFMQWLKWFCEAGGSPDEARLEQTTYPFESH